MILVTGATGMVGSHLLYRLLDQKEKVRAMYRTDESIRKTKFVFSLYENGAALFEKIEWYKGDVTDYFSVLEAMQGIEYVYHCAAIVSFNKRDADLTMKVNAEGTANVVNCALECNVTKFCFVSSVAAFGEHLTGTHIDETTLWKGVDYANYYAISKYTAEKEVWRASEEGLNVIIVNPAIIIGAGSWSESSSKIFKVADKGLLFYPKGSAGYVDINDVVACMIKLMNSTIANENFILCSENLTYKEFTALTASSLNKKVPFITAGKIMLKIASAFEWMFCMVANKSPELTRTIIRAVSTHTSYSNKKITAALSHNFIPIMQSVKTVAKFYSKTKKIKS